MVNVNLRVQPILLTLKLVVTITEIIKVEHFLYNVVLWLSLSLCVYFHFNSETEAW